MSGRFLCHHDQTPEKKNIKEDLVWLLVIEILTHGGESGGAEQFTLQRPGNRERGIEEG